MKLAGVCRQIILYALSIVALVATACGPATPVIDRDATATSVTEVAGARAAPARESARATDAAAPAATSAAQATATRNASIEHLEATATAQALRSLVEQGIAATAAALPTITPVAPTSTPQPPAATNTPIPAAPVQAPAPLIIISPQYVPVPIPVPMSTYGTPQFAIDAINNSNNAYAAAKWTLNQRDLEAGIAGRELADGRVYVQGLVQNRTRVTSTLMRGNVTSWHYSTPTRLLVSTDEVWRFTNYNADTYTIKRDVSPRLYRNDYNIDLLGGRWIVTLDSVPNPNGEAI
jgi:hypothetical protein